MGLLFLIFIIASVNNVWCTSECTSRDYGFGGTVCVCTAEHCDTLPEFEKPPTGTYVVYTSNKDGLRLQKSDGLLQHSTPKEENVVEIDQTGVLQEIFGFGGAFTDATGINIAALSQEAQEKLMRSYFTKEGLEYSICRVPIGGTDFSIHAYSYADGEEPDLDLENFSLQEEDYKYKIPYIKWAQNITRNDLDLLASAWTAPKWMKTNGKYNGGFLKSDMYQTWANYHKKFLEAYNVEGIKYWGITTGNEPIQALVNSKINSVGWHPWSMSKYIRENLGPTIRSSEFSNIKILMLDDMRFFLPWWTNWIVWNSDTSNYIDGIGVHWYFDNKSPAFLLSAAHYSHPDKFILSTEACNGDKDGDVHVTLGSWERGELYGNSIIEDMNHWVTGWMDWNMALDTEGGPTYISNNVDSPIIVNATADEFYKQPMYYVLGHFSKFVPKGSHKLENTQIDEEVPVTAFQRPDGGVVVQILNKKESEISISVFNGSINIPLTVTAKSLTTVVY